MSLKKIRNNELKFTSTFGSQLGIQRLTSEREGKIIDTITSMIHKKILKKSNTKYIQLLK
jgi:hypothetical protein